LPLGKSFVVPPEDFLPRKLSCVFLGEAALPLGKSFVVLVLSGFRDTIVCPEFSSSPSGELPLSFGYGRRRLAHPQGTCPDASQPELAAGAARTRRRQQHKHAKRQLLKTSQLPSSSRRDARATASGVDGPSLALAGHVLAWVRLWAARRPSASTCSGVLGCTSTMVITIVAPRREVLDAGDGLILA